MSYLVARMQKMKAGNLVGMGNHNQRLTDNHSNKDIDTERSYKKRGYLMIRYPLLLFVARHYSNHSKGFGDISVQFELLN